MPLRLKNAALRLLLGQVAVLAAATSAAATPINIALGKPVTLVGGFGQIAPNPYWLDASVYPTAPAASLTDGAFLPDGTLWQQGSVWWDARIPASVNNAVVVDLQGLFQIDGFQIQADNNDDYLLEYLTAAGVWVPVWQLPRSVGWGYLTRPNPTDIYYLSVPVIATGLRFTGPSIDPSWPSNWVNDGWYAVTEIQAFGTPVPEPSTLLLLGSGVVIAGLRRRMRRER